MCGIRYNPWRDPQSKLSQGNPCTVGTGISNSDIFYRAVRRDSATGDYQLGSRTYDPTKAAFIMSDAYRIGIPTANQGLQVDPLTMNRFNYVNGDPVNLVDPDGHKWCSEGNPNPECDAFRPRPESPSSTPSDTSPATESSASRDEWMTRRQDGSRADPDPDARPLVKPSTTGGKIPREIQIRINKNLGDKFEAQGDNLIETIYDDPRYEIRYNQPVYDRKFKVVRTSANRIKYPDNTVYDKQTGDLVAIASSKTRSEKYQRTRGAKELRELEDVASRVPQPKPPEVIMITEVRPRPPITLRGLGVHSDLECWCLY